VDEHALNGLVDLKAQQLALLGRCCDLAGRGLHRNRYLPDILIDQDAPGRLYLTRTTPTAASISRPSVKPASLGSGRRKARSG
jgi:hypothetical protein